jgi:hypothetical protein
VVAPPGAVEVDVPRSRSRRKDARALLASLAAGTPVVLCAAAPFARRRIRRIAREAGIELQREYLAFPSAATPAYLVGDARQPIRLFIEHALVVPPGMRVSPPVSFGVTAARRLRPARLLRLLAPGRLAIGRTA